MLQGLLSPSKSDHHQTLSYTIVEMIVSFLHQLKLSLEQTNITVKPLLVQGSLACKGRTLTVVDLPTLFLEVAPRCGTFSASQTTRLALCYTSLLGYLIISALELCCLVSKHNRSRSFTLHQTLQQRV